MACRGYSLRLPLLRHENHNAGNPTLAATPAGSPSGIPSVDASANIIGPDANPRASGNPERTRRFLMRFDHRPAFNSFLGNFPRKLLTITRWSMEGLSRIRY